MSRSNILKITITAMLALAANAADGQTSWMNYVMVTEPKTPSASVPAIGSGKAKVTVTYFDGLGREIENVAVAASPDGNDIVGFTEYNYRNLHVKKFLPVESSDSDGSFVAPDDIADYGEEQYGDSRPFSETTYEDDPTRRPVCEYKPGDDLQKKHVSVSYSFNSDKGMYACTLFKLNDKDTLENRGVYPANRLKVTRSTDEDGHETYLFTDKRGRTVLERRVMSDKLSADTYFIYDIYGDLRYMLSPEGSSKVTSPGRCDIGILDVYCYRYRYDCRHRMIERKLPGCEPEYFVYDKTGNVVYSQDGDERSRGVWHAVKYDAKGRKAIEGETAMSTEKMGEAGRAWLQAKLLDKKSVIVAAEPEKDYDMQLFYSYSDSYGTFTPQIAYFYDNYNHWNRQKWNDKLPFNLQGYPADSCLLDATGLLTGKAMVSGSQVWVTATVYDRFANPIVECAQEYHEGYTFFTVTNRDFRGLPTQVKNQMYYFDSKSIPPVSGETLYAYDNGDRISFVSHRYGDKAYWRVIKANGYDQIGRLKTEKIPPAREHALEYSYNTRGQVTAMEGDFFRQTLYYTSNPFDGPMSFSGNLSASEVSSLDMANGTPSLSMRKTSYTYDAFDRITEAADCSGGTGAYTPIEEYYRYDRNGNTEFLRREYGDAHWDAVQLVYRGNRIMRLTSAIKDADYLGKLPKMPFYAKSYPIDPVHYDAVGRLTSDDTRGIDTLKYVYGLARPSEVRFANGSRMINAFRADGTKVSEGITLRYLETVETTAGTGQEGDRYKSHSISRSFYGPIVSEFETTGRTTMYRIYNDAGYVLYDPKSSTGEYRYYIRDHLGNVRVEIDGDGNVVRAADYTASGIPIEKSWLTYPGPECYAGLAYYDELGNGWYDNNARLMESLMMRFTAMDPLCEKYPAISPYANCLCNPLRFSDPTGREVINGSVDANNNNHYKVIYDLAVNYKKYKDLNNKNIHLFAHGNKTSIEIATSINENGSISTKTISTPKELDTYLSETSQIWKEKGDNSNVVLVLHSCQTGMGNGSIAEQMSEAFPNITVIAPSDKIQTTLEKEISISPTPTSGEGLGSWKVFENGIHVNSFSVSKNFNSYPTLGDRIKEFVNHLQRAY